MKILLDTNVVLDLLLERMPFFERSKALFLLAETGQVEAYLSASSVTTIHYLTAKATNKKEADEIVEMLLSIFEITLLDKAVFVEALTNNGTDFEDSVIYSSARYAQIDFVITRDKKGFLNSKVKVLEPERFLAFFGESR